jgi:hypothetical protein
MAGVVGFAVIGPRRADARPGIGQDQQTHPFSGNETQLLQASATASSGRSTP